MSNPYRAYIIFKYDDAKAVVLDSRRSAERIRDRLRSEDPDIAAHEYLPHTGWHIRDVLVLR